MPQRGWLEDAVAVIVITVCAVVGTAVTALALHRLHIGRSLGFHGNRTDLHNRLICPYFLR